MTKNQRNKLRMYGTVDAVLDNNSTLFEWYQELILAHQRLKDNLVLLNQNAQIQGTNTTGLTTGKSLLKAELIIYILKFSAALRAYATSANNIELKVKSYYVKSELKKKPDPILSDIGRLLFELAIPVKSELKKYFIDDKEFFEIENLLTAFKHAYPKKRVATAESKVSTRNIRAGIKSTDLLMKDEIDNLIHPFQFTQADFYNIYMNARKIVNYSGRGKGKPDKPDESAEGEK